MLLFSVASPDYRKLAVMLRRLCGEESVATNWLLNYGHLVPPCVEIRELDPNKREGVCLLTT